MTVITRDVGGPAGIDQNLNEIPKLDLTNETAAKIRAAAGPLSGDAQQIIDAARSIDATVSDINTNAEAINGTVKQIADDVGSISASVSAIGGNATTLNSTVTHIRSGVAGINQRVMVVIDLANAIPRGPEQRQQRRGEQRSAELQRHQDDRRPRSADLHRPGVLAAAPASSWPHDALGSAEARWVGPQAAVA